MELKPLSDNTIDDKTKWYEVTFSIHNFHVNDIWKQMLWQNNIFYESLSEYLKSIEKH